MNNLEKMRAVGETIYGDNWQSPLSRTLGVTDRTVRNFISGKTRIPVDMSTRLLDAVECEINKLKSAVEIINSDKMRDEEITAEMLGDIANRHEYPDEQFRKAAIDAMNNAICGDTWLSDLDAIARRFAL
jgi:plasmid maintenance system antidote protein VapI